MPNHGKDWHEAKERDTKAAEVLDEAARHYDREGDGKAANKAKETAKKLRRPWI